jgi:IS6 family transposase
VVRRQTYGEVAGCRTYLYRAVDQRGQIIDVIASERRDGAAAREFFTRALTSRPPPVEVTTDRAPIYLRVLDQSVPVARHDAEQYANNRVEADHARLKARLRPMRTEDDSLAGQRRCWSRLRAEPAQQAL